MVVRPRVDELCSGRFRSAVQEKMYILHEDLLLKFFDRCLMEHPRLDEGIGSARHPASEQALAKAQPDLPCGTRLNKHSSG